MEFLLPLLIYVADVLAVTEGKIGLTACLVMCYLTYYGFGLMNADMSYNDEEKKALIKDSFKKNIWMLTIPILYCTFVPSQEAVYKIAAAYGVGVVVMDEDVQRIATDAGNTAWQALGKTGTLIEKAAALVEKKLDEGLANE